MHGWWAASYLVLWALVIVLSLVGVTLARQVGRLQASPTLRSASGGVSEGPPVGDALPAAELSDLNGTPVRIGGAGRQQLLLLVSPGCGVCDQLVPALAAVARTARVAVCVITDADPIEARNELGRASCPVVSAPELLARWGIGGTPFALALDRLGVVRGKGTVGSVEQLERIAASLQHPSGIGSPPG